MEITSQQKHFFETFGYLVLPGLLKEEIGWISEEFEAVFRDRGVVHDGSQRSVVVPFIDQRERLCTLLDHPAIVNLISGLIGDNFNYLGGDGNFYTGDTRWHSDGFHMVGSYLKVAFYLDPVTSSTGCLRVIPGSHRTDLRDSWDARKARDAATLWNLEQNQVPAVALESQPGDVVAFNHNLMHAALGGSKRRRMFTMNSCAYCQTPAELQELENFIAGKARFWVDRSHSEVMRQTASPQRMVYLQQVIDHEGHLPALAAKARAEMAEPARG
jgi:hypothetical protein